ncbi:MAG: hypothetical protein Q8K86_07085 [Candidatus Nanopelagicaceae bacterium]|nr:hypothetical protein [Candidatus Nanopelagicaceae bacterium]
MELNKETLAKMVQDGMNFMQVAKAVGKPVGEVLRLARESGINRPMKPLPIEEVYTKYQAGAALMTLRDEYGVPIPMIVRQLMQAHPDFKLRAEDEARRRERQAQGGRGNRGGQDQGQMKPLPIEEVLAKYQAGTTLEALSTEYGIPLPRIMRRLTRAKPDFTFRAEDEAKRPSVLRQQNIRPQPKK